MYRVQRINPFYCSKDFTHDVFGVLYIFTHFHIVVDIHYTVVQPDLFIALVACSHVITFVSISYKSFTVLKGIV
jgi:hypothetical protein